MLKTLNSGIEIDVGDMEFKIKVLNYIEQDGKDKLEIKSDLKEVKNTISSQKVDIAILQTKTSFIAVVAAAVFSGIFSWLLSMLKK